MQVTVDAGDYKPTSFLNQPNSDFNPEGSFVQNMNGQLVAGLYFSNLTDPDKQGGLQLFSVSQGALAELDGSGALAVSVGFQKGPAQITDLNGDGRLDIVNVDHGKEVPGTQINGAWPGGTNHLLLGEINGFVVANVAGLTDVQRFWHDISVADFDADGDQDIAITSFDSVRILENAGSLQFNSIEIAQFTNHGAIEFLDIDGDGSYELLTAPYLNWGTRQLQLYDPDTEWSAKNVGSQDPFGNGGVFEIASLGEALHGKTTLLFATETGVGPSRLFIGDIDAQGSMGAIEEIELSSVMMIRDLVILDMNNDGFEDLFLVTNFSNDLAGRIFLNDGFNRFSSSISLSGQDQQIEIVLPILDQHNTETASFLGIQVLSDGLQTRVITLSSPSATDGDDRFKATAKDDSWDGLDGLDTVVLNAESASVSVSVTGSEFILAGSQIGTNQFQNIERVAFSDKTLAFDLDGAAGQVYRLYQAAFDRTPDDAGLSHNVKRMDDDGVSIFDMASAFIAAQEFQLTYGQNIDDNAFLTLLYQNVLDRAPDDAGLAGWLSQLNSGTSREQVLFGFSESAENKANVAAAIDDGIWLI